MPAKLFAARYDDASYSGTGVDESFEDIANLGIRWALPGGIQRIELTIKAASRMDAYDRYQNHLGHRIAIYDSFCDRYIGGQVFEIALDGSNVSYICGGPWKRLEHERWNYAARPATGDTDALIKDVLTDVISIIDSDQTNIDASSVDGGGWTVSQHGAASDYVLVSDAITDLALIGDSSDNIMDFYFVDQPFNGVQMQKPLPYLKSRSATASPDWKFSQGDLVSGGLSLSRNIWNLTTNLRVYHNHITGIATGSGAADGIVNDAGGATTATFLTHKVSPGDVFYNLTTFTRYAVGSVDSETQLTVTDTGATACSTGDVYSIHLQNPYFTAAGAGTVNYWTVRDIRHFPELDQTQAAQIRDKLVNVYKDAVQQQSFVLGSPTIKDGNGADYPLWRPLMGDSFYFRVTDIFPEAALFSASDDRLQAFPVVAMDYTYNDNRLRIVPSTEDSRLDMLLARANLAYGQMINTEASTYRPGENRGGGTFVSGGGMNPGNTGGGTVSSGGGPSSYPYGENAGGGTVVFDDDYLDPGV
jgi:hypothetical protein